MLFSNTSASITTFSKIGNLPQLHFCGTVIFQSVYFRSKISNRRLIFKSKKIFLSFLLLDSLFLQLTLSLVVFVQYDLRSSGKDLLNHCLSQLMVNADAPGLDPSEPLVVHSTSINLLKKILKNPVFKAKFFFQMYINL